MDWPSRTSPPSPFPRPHSRPSAHGGQGSDLCTCTSPCPASLGGALRTMDRAGRAGPMVPLSTHLTGAGAQAQSASWPPRGRGSQEGASSPRKGAWSPPGLDPPAGELWKRQNWSLGSAFRNRPRTHQLHHLGWHRAERRAGRLSIYLGGTTKGAAGWEGVQDTLPVKLSRARVPPPCSDGMGGLRNEGSEAAHQDGLSTGKRTQIKEY